MDFYYLHSIKTKKKVNEKKYYTTDSDGSPIDIIYDYNYIKSKLNLYDLKHTPISHLKYLDFLPIKDRSNIITKGEGATPLYKLERLGKYLGLNRLYLKNEGANPTGVFKDRGTMVEITKAVEFKAKAVCVASTGNMAASVSAYSACAGIPCYVLVPEGTPVGKLSQTISYGARVLQIRGTYDDCVKLVYEMSKRYGYFLCGDYAFRREGQKTTSYEIVEQLNWREPDVVVCPVGFGTNLSAIYKGFYEFKKTGLTNSIPQFIGVQSKGCSPIADAWRRKSKRIVPVLKPDTIAQAVCVGDPKDAPFVFNALKQTKGRAVKVDDELILEAQSVLARLESIFVEPSSALPLAYLISLSKRPSFAEKFKDKTIVLIATGNGLKDPRSVLKNSAAPPSSDPNIKEVERFLRFKLYKLSSSTNKRSERDKIVIGKHINEQRLRDIIRDEFDLVLPSKYIKDMIREVEIFIKKKKPVSKIDLKCILEDTLHERAKNKILEFKDFKVTTSRNKRPKAEVVVRYKGGCYEAESFGVGPFDAIIKAFKKAVSGKNGLKFELIDYNVEIDTARSDATVKVAMTMKDDKGNKVISTGTSPDIIVASVLAYEEGYNLLLNY